jgi:glycosyltransferase involved in cell wall biosynthesis
MRPMVSVVLPVYNCEHTIYEAIDSVLKQSFADFELIVVDDKSTDNTVGIIKQFTDSRLKLLENQQNIGRAGSDNNALPFVQGKYIAKMDGDDICHPHRLEKQVAFLEEHPTINVVGSWIQCFGHSTYLHQYSLDSDQVMCRTLFGMPLGNPSVMLRSELFFEGRMRYDASLRQAEDYDFFARYREKLHLYVLPEPLVKYRIFDKTSRECIIKERKRQVDSIRRQFLATNGFALNEVEFKLLDVLYNLDQPLQPYTLKDVAKLFKKILLMNKEVNVFPEIALKRFLASRWFYACYHYPQKKLKSLQEYFAQDLSRYDSVSFMLKLKMMYKGICHF